MFNLLIGIIFLVIVFLLGLVFRRNETTKDGAPFVPLNADVVEAVLNLADIKEDDVFYDLGSGDGRLVIAAALKGAKAYGVEIDPLRAWYSRFCIALFRLSDRAKIIQKNIFDVDLSHADIVSAYLLQETNDKLQPKLEKEVKKGARIIGVAFNFPKWKPVKVDPRGPIYGPLYLYKKK